MTFTRTAKQTVTVLRLGASPGNDDYGNPLPGLPDNHDIPGCVFQPLLGVASMENISAEFDQIVTRWRGFGPADADLLPDDHIRVDGQDYAVDGDPVTWSRPAGTAHHTEFYAKRWEG